MKYIHFNKLGYFLQDRQMLLKIPNGKMAQIGAPLIIPEGFMDVKGK